MLRKSLGETMALLIHPQAEAYGKGTMNHTQFHSFHL